MKPHLKPHFVRRSNDSIILTRELGVQLTLPDPTGAVGDLLDLLDGTLTTDQVSTTFTAQHPDVAPGETESAIQDLDAAGLLEDAAAACDFTRWQQERYFSNLAFFGAFARLHESRFSFQQRLAASHVVLLGVGGLGSTLLFNLAGMGVGRVTAVDDDRVEAKNLARQFLYQESHVGRRKLPLAVSRAEALNSEITFVPVERRVRDAADIAPLIAGADLVLSAIDQPAGIQFEVNRACVQARVPFITGGMQVTRGIYYSVDPRTGSCAECGPLAPTRRDLEYPPGYRTNRGIGPVASLVASLMALESLRYLSGFAPPISLNRLWILDFATGEAAPGMSWAARSDCPTCRPSVCVQSR